jgi:hypothetical protein
LGIFIKSYKSNKNLVFLKYVNLPLGKKWVLYLNGHRYFWNDVQKYWVNLNSLSLDNKYYYRLPFFSNFSIFPRVNVLTFRTKIISLRKSNIFLKFGIAYRWNKTLFFNRMALFFIVAKRRIGFLKLWNLGFSKKLVIKYPFLAFKQNFSRKMFFSLKSFFLKSFFFRYLPYFFLRVNVCFNKFLFKNAVVFRDYFTNFFNLFQVLIILMFF